MPNGMPMMAGAAPGGPMAGPTGPATTAPSNQGLRARGMILATITTRILTEVVRLLGATSEEGRDALKALAILAKRFGEASGDLTRQEAKLMSERAGGVSQPTPQQAALFKQMISQKIGGMGMGASAAPAPAAPGPTGEPPKV